MFTIKGLSRVASGWALPKEAPLFRVPYSLFCSKVDDFPKTTRDLRDQVLKVGHNPALVNFLLKKIEMFEANRDHNEAVFRSIDFSQLNPQQTSQTLETFRKAKAHRERCFEILAKSVVDDVNKSLAKKELK